MTFPSPIGPQSRTKERAAGRVSLSEVAQTGGVLGVQLLAFWALNFVSATAVRALAVPVPGNLVGMLVLYALLSVGVVKVAWLDAAGSLLVKHLAFFFVPIAVGVMNMVGLLASHGIGITFTLVASAVIGIGLSGSVAQWLTAQSDPGDGP